jgi:hypothetical protein
MAKDQAAARALKATDAELEAYLAANRSDFRVEPRIAFQQIFINPEKSEESPAARAEKILSEITGTPSDSDIRSYGDPTLLPHAMPLIAASLVDRNFGEGFGRQLAQLPVNIWSGPVRSPFGLHLVRITERSDGYDPPLTEVRRAVDQQWRAAKRDALGQAEYRRLRDKYEVVLPEVAGANEMGNSAK